MNRKDGLNVFSDGSKRWFLDGKLHREDGPAIEKTTGKAWYLNGKFLGRRKPLYWDELVEQVQVEMIMES